MEGPTKTPNQSAITTIYGINRTNTADLFDGMQLIKPANGIGFPQHQTLRSDSRRRPVERTNRQLVIRIPNTSDDEGDLPLPVPPTNTSGNRFKQVVP